MVEYPMPKTDRMVADRHAGWDCIAGASLMANAESPGAGRIPNLHGVIYVCADHQADAEARITAAGYTPSVEDSPPGHRWDPWPCGHVTAYGLYEIGEDIADRLASQGERDD